MINFFHRLFNPHCTHCREEAREAKECHNCDVLTQLLEKERANNKQLLDRLTEPKIVEKIVERPNVNRQVVRGIVPNWATQQRLLEAEDRRRVEIMKKSTEEIEQEVGIKNG